MISIINDTRGHGEYKHHTGEIFPVEIAVAGMGHKKIRVANLPPEILDDTVRDAFAPFGQVLNVQNEIWARTYRYPVANGVLQIKMTLTQHIPSHLVIAEHRVLVSYDGQPTTCYGCGDTGHIYPTCPRRQRRAILPPSTTQVTYATIAATIPQSIGDQLRDNTHKDNAQSHDHVVDSNDKNMDTTPHEHEQCDSPLDSTQDAEMGDHHNPQPHYAETPDGAPEHLPSEIIDHIEEENDVCQQKLGTDAGQLPSKRDDLKSRQTPCHPVSSNQTSINEDPTINNTETIRTPQNRKTPQPAPSAPKR